MPPVSSFSTSPSAWDLPVRVVHQLVEVLAALVVGISDFIAGALVPVLPDTVRSLPAEIHADILRSPARSEVGTHVQAHAKPLTLTAVVDPHPVIGRANLQILSQSVKSSIKVGTLTLVAAASGNKVAGHRADVWLCHVRCYSSRATQRGSSNKCEEVDDEHSISKA